MRRLWVRLSLVFSLVILISVSLLIVLSLIIRASGASPGVRPFGILHVVTIVGGLVGILAGIAFSRGLTAPLRELADAARDIGTGDLRRRVAVRGSEEIVEVGQAFNQMAADLEHSEQLRSNLVADVAHELRTPLATLQGNLRAILDDVYPLSKEEVARLYEQTRHLSRMVDDLHQLVQAEARLLPLHCEPADLGVLIHNMVEIYAPLAASQEVTLRTEISPTLPLVEVDTARLMQVLTNLLSNALRHTPADGTIAIAVQEAHDTVRLTIADTGEGIPPEQLPTIFERFYRGDRSRTRETGGSGLGLAITRAIVEAHGGTINAYSAGRGQGSTFIIRLPRKHEAG